MAESRMSVLGAGRLRAECLGLEQDGREQNIREPETAGKRKRRTAGKRCVFCGRKRESFTGSFTARRCFSGRKDLRERE